MNKAVVDVQNAVAHLRRNAEFLRRKVATNGRGDPMVALDFVNLRRDVASVVETLGDAQKLLQELDSE